MRGFDLIYLFSLITSSLRGARLMVGDTRLSDGRCLEPSVTHLYLFWPRMSQTFYGLLVPQMCSPGHSGPLFLQVCIHAWKKTLSESFLDPYKTTSQGRLIKYTINGWKIMPGVCSKVFRK